MRVGPVSFEAQRGVQPRPPHSSGPPGALSLSWWHTSTSLCLLAGPLTFCTSGGQQFLSIVNESPDAQLAREEGAPGLGLEGPPPGGPREGWWARQMAPKAGQAHTALPPWYYREPHSGCCGLNLLPSRRMERGCPLLLKKAHAHPHTHTQELGGQGIHAFCLLGSQGFPAVGTSGLREESGRLMKEGGLCAVPTPEPDSHWQRRGAPTPAS